MHFSQSRAVTIAALLFTTLFSASSARAQANSQALTSVLAQLDAASAKFTSAQADIRQEIFTKVIHDTETQTGQIYFLRKSGTVQMGMKLLPPDAASGAEPAEVIQFANGKLSQLKPGEGQIDVYTINGTNKTLAEAVMNLGFGGSGKDLQKSFDITDGGTDTIDNIKVVKLDLVAKDAAIRNNFSRITIWVDPVRDVTLKQVLYNATNGQPSGDTRTAYYTNIRVNQTVDVKPFALACKGKCTTVNH